MRIAFLSAVYAPEREPAAVMAAQLVDRWIQDGHQVDVYCPFPNRPEGSLRRGWRRRLHQVDSRADLGDRVAVIGNWIDADEIRPMRAGNVWRQEHGIPAQVFLATFAGSLGMVSGADVLVRVAEHLRHRRDIFLVCVGEGVLKDKMAEETARLGLTNLRFLPFQPRNRISQMQSAADA